MWLPVVVTSLCFRTLYVQRYWVPQPPLPETTGSPSKPHLGDRVVNVRLLKDSPEHDQGPLWVLWHCGGRDVGSLTSYGLIIGIMSVTLGTSLDGFQGVSFSPPSWIIGTPIGPPEGPPPS